MTFLKKYVIIIICCNVVNSVRNYFQKYYMEKIKIDFRNFQRLSDDRIRRNIEIVLLKEGLPFSVEEINGEYFLVKSEPVKMSNKDLMIKYQINYNRVWMIYNQFKSFVYELVNQFKEIKNSIV